MTDVPRGRFVWFDLLTTDTDAGIQFYTDLMGWGTAQWKGSEQLRIRGHVTAHWVDNPTGDLEVGRNVRGTEIGGVVNDRAGQISPKSTRVGDGEIRAVGCSHGVRGHVAHQRFAGAAGGLPTFVGPGDEHGGLPDNDV